MVLVTLEADGHVVRVVRDRIDLGRRLARAGYRRPRRPAERRRPAQRSRPAERSRPGNRTAPTGRP